MATEKKTTEKKAATAQDSRGLPRFLQGLVVSNKMDKTVVISIVRQVKHQKYGKFVKKTSKIYAHDEANTCKIGDTVEVTQCAPLSKLKRWKIKQVLTRAAE